MERKPVTRDTLFSPYFKSFYIYFLFFSDLKKEEKKHAISVCKATSTKMTLNL